MAVGAMSAGAIGAVGLSLLGIAGALYGASFAAATLGTSENPRETVCTCCCDGVVFAEGGEERREEEEEASHRLR